MERDRQGNVHLFSRRTTLKMWAVGGFLALNDDTRAAIINVVIADDKNTGSSDSKPRSSAASGTITQSFSGGEAAREGIFKDNILSDELINATYDGWKMNPEYRAIIDGLAIEEYKKDYMKFIIKGVRMVQADGGLVNPRVMAAQAPIENGYGVDSVSQLLNFYGIKDGDGVVLPTHEDYGNGLVPERHGFAQFDNAFDSFYAYANTVNSHGYFRDGVACRKSDRDYLHGIQSVINDNCDVIAAQGSNYDGTNVKSYASSREYVDSVLNVIGFLRLDDIFTQTDGV